MDIELGAEPIAFADNSSEEILKQLLISRDKIHQALIDETSSIVGNDPNEITRIKNRFYWDSFGKNKASLQKWRLYKSRINSSQTEDNETGIRVKRQIYIINSLAKKMLSQGFMFLKLADSGLEEGNYSKFQYFLFKASIALGSARGCLITEKIANKEKTAFYKAAAAKRHSENNAIRADALKYYAENIGEFKSMDAAAEAIAGKIVNAKFRTVRDWITQYHKKIRSTSRP